MLNLGLERFASRAGAADGAQGLKLVVLAKAVTVGRLLGEVRLFNERSRLHGAARLATC